MKIQKEEFKKIIIRIENGESFSTISKEYKVTPWAIAKRYGKKPTREVKIWELVPDFQKMASAIERKYWNFSNKIDVYNYCMDVALSITPAVAQKIKQKGAGVLFVEMENRLKTKVKSIKTEKLVIMSSSGVCLNNIIN